MKLAAACCIALLGSFGLVGCAVSADEEDTGDVINSCDEDAECNVEGRCLRGMCVAREIDAFNVYLQVTPRQRPDGSQGRPVWLHPMRIDAPIGPDDPFIVPEPAAVEVSVVKDGMAIDAVVRLREVPLAVGLPVRELEVEHAAESVEVSLSVGARYEVLVEPDSQQVPPLPPLRQTVDVTDGLLVEFDYGSVALSSRHFLLDGLAAGGSVRAVHSRTGHAVSSTATAVAESVMLTFAPGEYPYTLEITPAAPLEPTSCNRAGIAAASYRITVVPDGADGVDPAYEPAPEPADDDPAGRAPRFEGEPATLAIALPIVQPLITYRGTVEQCGTTGVDVDDVGPIPINLRSTHLRAPDGLGDGELQAGIAAEAFYNASTTADYDREAQKVQFCVEVFPGDYEVVVAAPGSIGCGIFAEERLLEAPPGSAEKAGDSLTLTSTASIEGNLSSKVTAPMAAVLTVPVANATVAANPLARADGINLAVEDRGVTQYNRPRQTTTDEVGDFSLSLDVGAYDVTVKPPGSSGLAWLIVRDVLIADRDAAFPSELTAAVPVPIEGILSYGGDDSASLAGAELRAFTLLGDGDQMRTIEIGEATADEDGHFLLLAPATTSAGLWGDGTE